MLIEMIAATQDYHQLSEGAVVTICPELLSYEKKNTEIKYFTL